MRNPGFSFQQIPFSVQLQTPGKVDETEPNLCFLYGRFSGNGAGVVKLFYTVFSLVLAYLPA